MLNMIYEFVETGFDKKDTRNDPDLTTQEKTKVIV